MSQEKWMLIISSALVIGLLTACGTSGKLNGGDDALKAENSKQNEIAAKFHPTIETKEEDHSTIVHYKVKNISGELRKLTFPSGLEADFIVYDQAGKKVKQFSDEVATTQAIKEVTLENNQEIVKEFTISDLYKGHYRLEVFLTSKEEEAKVVTDIIVE